MRVRLITVGALVAAIGLGFLAFEQLEAPQSQVLGVTLVHGPRNRPDVALTFDDGPNPPYTSAILDVLERARAHATFFVVGRAAAAYPGLLQREARDGDEIGNHSWAHEHLIVLTPSSLRTSLERTSNAIRSATGITPTLMRPPFGQRDPLVLQTVRTLGMTPVMWSVPLARDWRQPPAQTIVHRLLAHVHAGDILVLHDGDRGILCARPEMIRSRCNRTAEIEAVRLLIPALRARGFHLVTVTQLFARTAQL